jgi:hypothetical protein
MTELVETLCHWCGANPCICPRRAPCACGGWILASKGTPGVIRDAVLQHNRTEQHLRWSAALWDRLESLPGFNEDLRQAERDLEAGRGTRYELHGGVLRRSRP